MVIGNLNINIASRVHGPVIADVGMQEMITRTELAQFIRKVADGTHSQQDWERIAVNHYHDKEMENARRELVRICLGYAGNLDQTARFKRILSLADELETIK
jgi:hypothetical protein